MRYYHVLNNGEAYCRYHHGVRDSVRVHEITRRLHELAPVFRQVSRLNSLNASQVLGDESVLSERDLPAACRRYDGEPYRAWMLRLQAYIGDAVDNLVAGVANG
ncbi:MAG: hypothetical protein KZQ95_01875 [Candidatus Thiodiazotropha sp. (ex Epidulcina cf. delphinae)]|nr:hypothetical protein [Candidatus Thiodiazotropha sp. (ex Epidulcina cf. delphinae)]